MRWEYRAFPIFKGSNVNEAKASDLEDRLNPLGQHAWELVAFVEGYAIFKRPEVLP